MFFPKGYQGNLNGAEKAEDEMLQVRNKQPAPLS